MTRCKTEQEWEKIEWDKATTDTIENFFKEEVRNSTWVHKWAGGSYLSYPLKWQGNLQNVTITVFWHWKKYGIINIERRKANEVHCTVASRILPGVTLWNMIQERESQEEQTGVAELRWS